MTKQTVLKAIILLMVMVSTSVYAQTIDKPILIKIGMESNKESAQYVGLKAYKDYAESASKGRIKVEIFDSGALGVDKDAVTLIKTGTVQGWDVNTSLLSTIEPAFMILDLPFSSSSIQELEKIMDNGFGKILSDKLTAKTNLYIASWFIKGTRNVYGNSGPISSPKDMAGMKIRVMQNPVMVKTMELLGAKPVPLAASERYLALQSGVVNAAEGAIGLIILQKEYEVAKYVSLTGHFNTPNALIMEKRVYENAPADLKVVLDAAGKACQRASNDYDIKYNEDGVKILTDKGVKVNQVADITPFIEIVKPIWVEYEPKIGKDVMEKYMEYKKSAAAK
jgi:tripartite ATP-independent transporter DctP family solute receptor